MAVQKNKKTSSKKKMRRSHDFLKIKSISVDKFTGKIHFRHHIDKEGFYRGKKYNLKK